MRPPDCFCSLFQATACLLVHVAGWELVCCQARFATGIMFNMKQIVISYISCRGGQEGAGGRDRWSSMQQYLLVKNETLTTINCRGGQEGAGGGHRRAQAADRLHGKGAASVRCLIGTETFCWHPGLHKQQLADYMAKVGGAIAHFFRLPFTPDCCVA